MKPGRAIIPGRWRAVVRDSGIAAVTSPTYQASILPGRRLHLHEGPIDLVIGVAGDAAAVGKAHALASGRFDGLLSSLVAELPALRSPVSATGPVLHGAVAQRMLAATRPHCARFVTPMAAVAGAVADEVLGAMASLPGLTRAYVNNGGDIAIHLSAGETIRLGTVSSLAAAAPDGFVTLSGSDAIRGIATSGAGGRSFSLGIADAVTILAHDAASADVAATLIGNAVNVDHPAIERAPASSLDPDSDLGEQLVTLRVGALPPDAISQALNAGMAVAQDMLDRDLIYGGLLCLGDQTSSVGRAEAFARRVCGTTD